MKNVTKKCCKKLSLFCLLLFIYSNSFSQTIWEKASNSSKIVLNKSGNDASVYSLRVDDFRLQLNAVTTTNPAVLLFPEENGESIAFKVYETKVMHPELEAKFPELKSYRGVSVGASNKIIAFTYSPRVGFRGVFESKTYEKTEVKPLTNSLYEFRITSSQEGNTAFLCETEDYLEKGLSKQGVFDRDVNDGNLRRYRLALSVSGDYSQVFLDGTEADDDERKTKVLQAMVGSVNRLNGIFERDFGISMQLIPNTDLLIFLNPATDPYTTGSSLRSQLVNTLANNITNNDYDVGHLFHQEANRKYGNAGCIACVCTDTAKGQAYSVHGNPDQDDMNLLAAHEFGHQFGAFHTQSSRNCRSGNNSEVEPGSGTTIMSYAGICPPNVQSGADDYFNYTSIRDVANWTINNSSCAELIPTNNTAPVVTPASNYVIPKSTAFVLEGSATDSDGNESLSFCWEQNDPQDPVSTSTPQPTNLVGPMFRSLPPAATSKRYFPDLGDVLSNNLTPTWEVLPSVSRRLNFVMTVRDNHVNGGQVVSDAVYIDVSGDAGPFAVTSQNGNSEVWTVGELVTVNWDVAGTNEAPINTSQVEILLSIDGGQNFPYSLIVTDNDGSQTFNLPDVEATANARIMIKGHDNVFFAVNQNPFTIVKSEYAILSDEPHVDVCSSESAVLNLKYKTFLSFEEEVNVSASNLPEGTTATFSQESFSGSDLEGTSFFVTLSGLENLEIGDYSFNVSGLSESGIEKSVLLDFTVFDAIEEVPNLVQPLNDSDTQALDLELTWDAREDSISYLIEIATDDSFDNIIEEATVQDALFVPSNLENNQLYYWRVQFINPCGTSSFSTVYNFSTACGSPSDFLLLSTEINSIEFSWDDVSNSSSWTVEYGVSGFSLGTGTSIELEDKQTKVEGLESGTEYDFYIAGNCSIGGSSAYIGPFEVSTDSDYCSGDHFYDSGGPDNNYGDNENITTVIAPETESERVRVRFNSFETHFGNDFLRIYNGENDEATLLGTFTGTELRGQEFVSTTDTGTLTFVFTSNSFLNFSGWDATVTCEEKPNCFEPIDFQIASLKGDEVSLIWTENGDDSNWELEYGLAGFERGSGELVDASATSITIENLVPLTAYEVYIKTVCDAGGFSEVVGPLRFVTTELCSTPTDLSITSFTNDSVTVTWDNLNGDVALWEVQYGSRGFDLGSGTSVEASEKNITINQLVSNSEYDLYVRSNCEPEGDGFSNWAGPIPFKTTPDYCNGDRFYDSGGPTGNYSNSENTTTTIHPKTLDERVRVIFNSFLVESCCDRLRIYDGPDTQSPYLGAYSSNPGTIISSHESGALTFVFTSDSSVTSSGWEATVVCEEKPNCVAPTNFRFTNIEAKQVGIEWNQVDNESSWTIEYGEIGFIPGEGTVVVSEEASAVLTGLSPETDYDIYVKANCSEGGHSDSVGPLRVRTPVACFVPQSVTVSTISTNSVSLIWDLGTGNENEWEIEYGSSGFQLGTGTKVSSTTNTVLIENLTANTLYDVYVRANCDSDGYSNWSSLLEFKTDCNVIEAPYKESFVATNVMPDCWKQNNIGYSWKFNKYAGYEASNVRDRSTLNNSNYAWLDGSYNPVNGPYTLKTPWVDISSLSSPSITFSAFSKNTYNDIYNTLEVTLYDSNGTVFSGIITVNSSTNIWRDFVVDLSDYNLTSNIVQLEFEVTLNSSTYRRYNDILIDEVNFDELPSCSNPINPMVTNITGRTADFSWESTDDETNWEIQYGFSGFNVSGATTVFTTDNPYTLTSLLPERSYDVYVRAVCGIGDSSEFIGPITFTTTELCPTPTNFRVDSATKNSAELSWDDVSGDAQWEVEYKVGYFSPGLGTVETSSTNSLSLTGLLPDTTYYAYLRRNCGEEDGISNSTRYIIFRTEVACAVPIGFRTTEVTKNTASLEWQDSGNVTEWDIEYHTDYFIPGNGIGTTQTVLQNSLSLEGLASDTWYYVYLRSNCGEDDGYSNWTGYLSFKTQVSCNVPTSFRANEVTKNSATFEWENNSNASEWEVEYNTSYFTPGNGIGTTQVALENSLNLEGLVPDTAYYVYLRSYCGEENGYSRWTNYLYFQTDEACTIPFGFTTSDVTKNSATLEWQDNGDANEWELEYHTSFFSPGNGIGTVQTASVNNITLEGLEPNTFYYVYLRSNCGDDGYSNWVGYILFRTLLACSTPTNFKAATSTQNSTLLTWDEDENVAIWDIEYSSRPFSPGGGTRTTVLEPSILLDNLNGSTLYYAYLRSNCNNEGYSNWTSQISFTTLCESQSEEGELIVNGGFECGSTAGWTVGGPNVFSGCSVNFSVLENSNSVCSIVNNINPQDGQYAAYTSFDGSANTTYSFSQSIEIPSNIASSSSAILSFDFKVNYKMTFNNPTQERVFEVRFTDLNGVQLFQVDELKFGLDPNEGEIERNFSNDILTELSNYAGQTISLNFQAFVPESSTGPSKAMLDNVSLLVDEILSKSSTSFNANKLLVYPIPNKGDFSLNNLNGQPIDQIEIFDVSGRLIQTERVKKPSQQVEVSMLNVTSGVYFIKILIDGNKHLKRILVE
ncbi:fibronectin type III domain-containing protein [Cognatitamlana onchidii]|uniref:fibronectin type III domain-containing protein n=1 Tax=Cognatitamlana onchidii TaxID=2562860 RepID=UPI0010A616EF|nr:fibronectin type III domain-containing protein [Algibacter onchidii]